MKKVFIDKDGACEWESFNIGKTTRPYIEVSNDVDLSKKCIENGQLRDKTSAEIEDEIYNAELVLIQQKRREEYGNVGSARRDLPRRAGRVAIANRRSESKTPKTKT